MTDHKDDKKFILDPDAWPKWPVLPMKKPGSMKGGIIVGDPVDGKAVHFIENANIWHITEADWKRAQLRNIDELLNEGWVID